MSEGIGTIEDLVKGIETSFDNTPLEQTIGEYNFDGSCDKIDNDSYTVERTLSTMIHLWRVKETTKTFPLAVMPL
jgi:hypothetical protein